MLENLTLPEANYWEEYYIREHNTLYPYGYNLKKGGYNYETSELVKSKISIAMKRYFSSPQSIQKVIARNNKACIIYGVEFVSTKEASYYFKCTSGTIRNWIKQYPTECYYTTKEKSIRSKRTGVNISKGRTGKGFKPCIIEGIHFNSLKEAVIYFGKSSCFVQNKFKVNPTECYYLI